MKQLITYIIMVNGAIALFYLLYKLLFQRDTFFRLRRYYLLSSLLFALIYPLLPIYSLGALFDRKPVAVSTTSSVIVEDLSYGAMIIDEPVAAPFDWSKLLAGIYLIGVAFFTLRLLWQVLRLIHYRLHSEAHSVDNITYRQLKHKQAPFSFFKWIFVDASSHSDEKLQQILIHEQIHATQWHSLDVMLSEVLRMLFWFNPFVWLVKKEIVINLEYIADNGVLGEGIDRRDYQYHLLHLTYPTNNIQLTNKFNVSQLKQRITMMNKEKTPMRKLAKYLMVLPVVMLLITANSVYAQQTNPKPKKESAAKLTIQDKQSVVLDSPLYVIDDVVIGKESDININSIDREDVKSVSVLRDKTATELYGEDGKDGVIIIATYSNWGEKYKNDPELRAKVQSSENKGTTVVRVKSEKQSMKIDKGDIKASNNSYTLQGKPLVIIDGKKVDKNFKLNDIDPGNIASMTVLKKEEEIKQYGDEAKDGVIIITTKQASGGILKTAPAKQEEGKEVFVVVEGQPEFPGGNKAMQQFLADNIHYPEIAKEKRIQGRVILNFVIEPDGSITEIEVVRGVDPVLDQEAINVINKMPNWKPGMQRGEAVRVRFTLPVSFRLPTEVPDGTVVHRKDYKEDPAKGDDEIFVVVENQPEFPGGMEGMKQFLAENVQYPPIAKENGIQGRVIVNFVIEKDGSISNIQVVRGVDPSLDMEATRVIEAMPNWKPGTQRGQKVRVRFTLPIVFRLPEPKTDDVPPPPPPPPASDDKS